MNEEKRNFTSPTELDKFLDSIPCEIEQEVIRVMKNSDTTELPFGQPVRAVNAIGEEEADIISATYDKEDNTIILKLDTTTDCDYGYISDQTIETARAIYYAVYWEMGMAD